MWHLRLPLPLTLPITDNSRLQLGLIDGWANLMRQREVRVLRTIGVATATEDNDVAAAVAVTVVETGVMWQVSLNLSSFSFSSLHAVVIVLIMRGIFELLRLRSTTTDPCCGCNLLDSSIVLIGICITAPVPNCIHGRCTRVCVINANITSIAIELELEWELELHKIEYLK